MSGFTHRITNQIHGASIRPEQARQFLEQGWVDDQLWLLRTLHEFTHAILNFSAVATALVLVELSMDRLLYEMPSSDVDSSLLAASRESLSYAYDLLSPWSEAIALINEFDLDLTVDHPTEPHEWMAKIVGADAYDEYLWRARLSSSGTTKKANTLVSSCYAGGGHLLGHIASRVLQIPGEHRSKDILDEVKRCVFDNINLAHAILDLTENMGSISTVEKARRHLAGTFARAVECLHEELLYGPSSEYSSLQKIGKDKLLRRMLPLIQEFEKPVALPRPTLENIDLREAARVIASQGFSMRALVGLGTASIDLVSRGAKVSCVVEGDEVYSFNSEVGFEGADHGTIERIFCAVCGPSTVGIRVSSDARGILHTFGGDGHMVTAFNRVRIPTRITEAAQAAAALLTTASVPRQTCPSDPAPSRRLAAEPVRWLVEKATGASINLQSLSPCGVAEALDWDGELLTVLARLSNEFSSVCTPGGRAALPDGPVVSDDHLAALYTRLLTVTGLPLAARTKSAAVFLW